MNTDTLKLAWLALDFDPETRAEAAAMTDPSLIQKRFSGKRLEFGTAGLRAPMGAGFDRMNAAVVLQTTQGLCAYLQQRYDAETLATRGVVLGYDGRKNSKKFAHVAAAVFLAKNVKVYLFRTLTPTPVTPFVVAKLNLCAGVQVTASHNPKDDNGYKLFAGETGAQIIPPVDSEIAAKINENLVIWQGVLELLDAKSILLKDQTLAKTVDCGEEIANYVNTVTKDLCRFPSANGAGNLKFTYTAMHGVGYATVAEMFTRFGFKAEALVPVEAQKLPDPEFPTVKFPNPEEKGALNIAVDFARSVDADYVLANDPDADRFTAVERQADGTFKTFTGDQLGVLFADWQISNFKGDMSKGLLITSTVSSRMLKALADHHGCRYKDTLTGFKWMASESANLRQAEPQVVHLLAYEEAIGYQLTPSVPDKDGISALCVWAEMATSYRTHGLTIYQRLLDLQKSLGIFVTNNGYYISRDPAVTLAVFDDFRNGGQYRETIGDFQIISFKDITKGVNSDLPKTPDAQMIQLIFANGANVTLRASGTEPKIKYYTEISTTQESQGLDILNALVKDIIAHFFKPHMYNVEAPKN